jgi:hypothetical protein
VVAPTAVAPRRGRGAAPCSRGGGAGTAAQATPTVEERPAQAEEEREERRGSRLGGAEECAGGQPREGASGQPAMDASNGG